MVLKGMFSHPRGVLVCLAALVAAAAAVDAQQFVLSSQDRARLVAVDFAATTAEGEPVADLRADEVTLRIDGRVRTVQSLEYVAARGFGGHSPIVPYGSNVAEQAGRSIILVVDFETIQAGREATLKEHVGHLVRSLNPDDRLALVTVPYGGVKVDLTTDHARVAQSIALLSGQFSASAEAGCSARNTLVALRGLLMDLRGGQGPVAVVFFSNQMAGPQGVQTMQTGVSISRCQLVREHFQQVGDAAASARAQFYVVQPELSPAAGALAGLEHLTGVTGGPLWHLSDLANGAMARVIRETGGYYLARFFPEPDETQGSIHRLDVSIGRPDVSVRVRPYMAIERPATKFSTTAPTTTLAMMKEARAYRDLPLRVAGFTSREAGSDTVRISVLFDSPDPSAALTDAMVGLFDESGRMVASRVLQAAELQSQPVLTALSTRPGHYRLRVAAAESTGRGGTADFTLEAGLVSAGALRLSDLVLGLSRDGQFRPKLEFGRESTAMAHLEVYGGQEGARVGVVFEVAQSVSGPALAVMPGVFAATTEADRFMVSAAIPIGALPPGDYVVRATIAAENQAGGRVVRPIRKVAR